MATGLHQRQNSEPSSAVVIDTPDHAATLLSQLSLLRTDRASSDTVLVTGNTEVLCHRAVLAASSPYFHAMFHSTLRESREQRIKLDGVTSLALRRLIDYIYTGRIEVSFTSSSNRLQSVMGIDWECYFVESTNTSSVPTLPSLPSPFLHPSGNWNVLLLTIHLDW